MLAGGPQIDDSIYMTTADVIQHPALSRTSKETDDDRDSVSTRNGKSKRSKSGFGRWLDEELGFLHKGLLGGSKENDE